MKGSGSMNDLKESVERYLEVKRRSRSLAAELGDYALWLPFCAAAHWLGCPNVSFLCGTWFVLGVLVVLFMRQSVVALRWWHVLPCAAVAAFCFSVSGNFPASTFFFRYLVAALVGTATLLPFVPAGIASSLPEVLFSIGLLQKPRT